MNTWLDEHAKEKFFLFIHCYDTHEPFIAHAHLKEFEEGYSGPLSFLNSHSDFIKNLDYEKYRPFIKDPLVINSFYEDIINQKRMDLTEADKDHIIALYDNEIRFVDSDFGQLILKLKSLNLYERTIIILWADHGEELLERGRIQHSGSVFEEIIKVPLIIYIPDYPGSAKNPSLTQSIDIAPTILDILRVKPESSFKGIPLFSPEHPGNRHVIAEQKRMIAIRTERYKLMVDRKTYSMILFDLANDPDERENVAEAHPEIVRRLREELFDTLNIVDLDKKTKEKLKALGYIR